MPGDKPREQGLEEIVNANEPVPQQPLDARAFLTGKENPAVMKALDDVEKRLDAREAVQEPVSPEEAKAAKSRFAKAEIKKLADKYESVSRRSGPNFKGTGIRRTESQTDRIKEQVQREPEERIFSTIWSRAS